MNTKGRVTLIVALVLAVLTCQGGWSEDLGVACVDDSFNILPLRERAEVINEWLRWRLDNIIPKLMRREGIDMWLIINREYNEDPVYMTMVPEPTMYARRTSILMFVDRGEEKGVERLSGSYYGMRGWYEGTWTDKSRKQFESLAEVIRGIDPKKIGIDVSPTWRFGDGLTATLKEKLEAALGPGLSSRFVSAENLCVGWLETRSPMEIGVYRHICGIAHDIIREFFSNRIITPGITTTQDVVWWIRQKILDLGLETWFQPSISIQRHEALAQKYKDNPRVIQRGDLVHCDVGIRYLRLCTDMQWQAYVCHAWEDDAPEGIKEALRRANEVGRIFLGEFKEGRSGGEIKDLTMRKATEAGLRPLLYSHPLGFHGHAAGPPMDARPVTSAPEGIEANMRYPLYPATAYAIEFSATTSVPEWDGQDVRIGFEEDALFVDGIARFIDGYQKKLLLIK
jgi:Xaa-Pro aminopeptidase